MLVRMWSSLALALLGGLACLDLGLWLAAKRGRLGRARWSLWVAPVGCAALLVARSLAEEHAAARWCLQLGLPVLAFLAGFAYLLTAFTSERRAARVLFALHTAAAIVLGVLATLALEADDRLGRLAAAVERGPWSS